MYKFKFVSPDLDATADAMTSSMKLELFCLFASFPPDPALTASYFPFTISIDTKGWDKQCTYYLERWEK